jgi:hypothetical protein
LSAGTAPATALKSHPSTPRDVIRATWRDSKQLAKPARMLAPREHCTEH